VLRELRTLLRLRQAEMHRTQTALGKAAEAWCCEVAGYHDEDKRCAIDDREK
jgi:hypothetical protein